MRNVYKQQGSGVRFDWGLVGAQQLSTKDGCLVVVDVLSFTTAVSVCVSRDIDVYPYRWNDDGVATYARENDAVLAAGRLEVTTEHPWSLSTAALKFAPHTPSLVLPSPNGSTIATASAGMVVAASLRNGTAVGRRLAAAGFGTAERPVTVVAAGERWGDDDSLRPCVEDLLGAGCVIAALLEAGCMPSAEARIASTAFATADINTALFDCASGRELIEDGFEQDVHAASELDADTVMPVLKANAFVNWTA